MFRATYGSSQWNVSNPAQNRPLQAVIINDRNVEIRIICSMTPAAHPQFPGNGEKAGDRWNPFFVRSAVGCADG